MNANELKKWDIIRFRRSNERKTKEALVWSVETETNMLGEQQTIAVITIMGKKQILVFKDSLKWSYLYNLETSLEAA